jgi:hypothetical protein
MVIPLEWGIATLRWVHIYFVKASFLGHCYTPFMFQYLQQDDGFSNNQTICNLKFVTICNPQIDEVFKILVALFLVLVD